MYLRNRTGYWALGLGIAGALLLYFGTGMHDLFSLTSSEILFPPILVTVATVLCLLVATGVLTGVLSE